MLEDIVKGRPPGQHRPYLRFENGIQGAVDIASMIDFTRVPASLDDRMCFAQVTANPETGTIT